MIIMDIKPLAEKLRPTKLKDVVGQDHILGKNGIINQIVYSKQPISLIFWGPPGSGKTTLARIIANEAKADFVEISAVAAGLADVKLVIKRAEENKRLDIRTILFVDEIHRFNKAQQDAFLPHVESGLISLIGATTENPSFEVISPLLSRSRVIVLEPLSKKDIGILIKRAAKELGVSEKLDQTVIEYIAEVSGGDARIALNTLELSLQLTRGKIDKETVNEAAQTKVPTYDKGGEMHYNIISAFIKSLRGSDANAALYYLARMLNAGEDPKFIARRMVIFASEDVGLAASPALNLAISTFLAVERIGMPECSYNLFHCATVLAASKKSRVVADAMQKAMATAKQFPDLPVPIHLRNAPTKLMKDLGYGKGSKWEAGFQHPKGFLPEEIKNLNLF
jgi:putative ATPase